MSAGPPRLLVATFNPGKARELVRLLSPLDVLVLCLADLGLRDPYEETGPTYEENARGKALHYAALGRLPALADDSGLEVDALGGRPGPLSARYGGADLDDTARCRLILREIAGVPEEKRTARFVAVAALARPGGAPGSAGAGPDPVSATRLFRATCAGRIAAEMRGARGFGYDPIFFYPPLGATFGEIGVEQKDRISHRALALAQVTRFLKSPEGRAFLMS